MTQFLSDAKRNRIANGELRNSSDAEKAMFFDACERLRLDPEARQVFPVKRGGKVNIGTTIDGFRLIAERSGLYAGQVGPWFCGEDGEWRDVWLKNSPPVAAKVGVLRSDFKEPVHAVALWSSYYGGTNNPIAKKMPDVMLAKCAEALALRKAFPDKLSGVYTNDEMEQAGEAPAPPPARKPSDQPNLATGDPIAQKSHAKLEELLHAKGLTWAMVVEGIQEEHEVLLPPTSDRLPKSWAKRVKSFIDSHSEGELVDTDSDKLTPDQKDKAKRIEEAAEVIGDTKVVLPGSRGDE